MFRMGNSLKYHAANYGQMNLLNELRKLWMEHIMWTRLSIVSALADLPDLDATTKRLLRNPSDFANVLEIFYGKQKADVFRSLLEEHLKIASSILDSAKRGDSKAVEQYSRLWYSNADKIAAFLAGKEPEQALNAASAAAALCLQSADTSGKLLPLEEMMNGCL